MIISASIQAADPLNILQSIHQHSSEFDQIHVDITDGHFTNNISMSFSHIKEV
jgi:pentose-5-phosphate-3-epimerase